MSDIEWTGKTWNPTTGCDRVSPGCDHCYAMTLARRLKGMGSAKYQCDGDPRTSGPGFGITEHPDALTAPLSWRKPSRVFVNSMSDLFHDGVSDGFIARVWAVMAATPQHTYQVLTKRHGRMRSLISSSTFRSAVADLIAEGTDEVHRRELVGWPLPNVWLGVSVEDQKRADLRIPALLDTPAAVRFLSCEPLLGPVDLSLWLDCPHDAESGDEGPVVDLGRWPTRWRCDHCSAVRHDGGSSTPGLHWVICGGESGPGARPMDLAWVEEIVDQCQTAGVSTFVKQLGSVWAGHGKGGDMDAWPAQLRIREYPLALAEA